MVREVIQDVLEPTGGLTGADDVHREGTEHPWVRAECLGELPSGLDVLHDVKDDRAETRIHRLVHEGAQRLHDRHLRRDHDRELPEEHDDVPRPRTLDLDEEVLELREERRFLTELCRDVAAPVERLLRIGATRRVDASLHGFPGLGSRVVSKAHDIQFILSEAKDLVSASQQCLPSAHTHHVRSFGRYRSLRMN